MGKFSIGLTCIAITLTATSVSAKNSEAEIGYERGALGFEALMLNDNETALRQLQSVRTAKVNDPARLINLGRAYARLGNKVEARQAFEAAINCRDEFDLVLAGGTVMNSRKAARQALLTLGN